MSPQARVVAALAIALAWASGACSKRAEEPTPAPAVQAVGARDAARASAPASETGATNAVEPESAQREAIDAAGRWLMLIDEGKYEQSWTETAAVVRDAVTSDRWKATMDKLRQPLGRVVAREVKRSAYKTELPGAPAGHYVVIEFETQFDGRSVREVVTPARADDGTWRVSGYYVR